MNSWDRTELGPYLGYLPQDIELFDGTLAENIARFGDVDAERVIAAAQCTGLHEMILRFPKGYDTPIGEAGSMLSGGQRQRIGLARAVYGDPALIVLDEPNSNLDDAGELALIKTVKSMKALGKTVILITHRPGILAVADRLLILQDGRVQAEGPRDGVLEGRDRISGELKWTGTVVDLAGLTDPVIAQLPGGHTSKRVTPALLDAHGVDTLVFLRRRGATSVDEDGGPYERGVEARLAEEEWVRQTFERTGTLTSGPLEYVIFTRRNARTARPLR